MAETGVELGLTHVAVAANAEALAAGPAARRAGLRHPGGPLHAPFQKQEVFFKGV